MMCKLPLGLVSKAMVVCIGLVATLAWATENQERLVIADAQGDWGLLAPYLHQARGPGYVYTSFVFDSLLWKDDQGKIQPLLATDWFSDDEQRCYTFTLNAQARWHDGNQLDAEDVAFTFNYIQQHPYRFVDTHQVSSINTTPGQIEICMDSPDPLFIERVASTLPIMPQHIYAEVDNPDHFAQPAALIGSGPYKLEQYQRAQGFYQLRRNEHWHLGLPRYAEVVITRLSPQAAAVAMQQGDVDLMSITYEFIDLFQSAGANLLETASNHPYRLLFNHQQSLQSVRLRQGLAQAINRQQLIDLAFHGNAQAARPAYRQQGSMVELNPYLFDLDAARSALQQAGWQQDSQGRWLDEQQQPIQLKLVASTNAAQLVKVLAQQFNALGLELTIRLLQDVPLTKAVQDLDFDLALLSQSHQGDPDRFRTLLTGRHSRGDNYIANHKLIELLEQMQASQSAIDRESLFLKAEQLYNADLPSLPLVNPTNFTAERITTGAAYTPEGIAMGIPLAFNKFSLFLPQP